MRMEILLLNQMRTALLLINYKIKKDIINLDGSKAISFRLKVLKTELLPKFKNSKNKLQPNVGAIMNESYVSDNFLRFGINKTKESITNTANKINAGYSLSANNPTQPLAWGEYSTIIRFNTDGLIDVRDGVTYNADASMAYTANTIYDIEMNVDVPNKKYSVSVTPQGGSTVILAKDYDFRVAADKLSDEKRLTES